MPSAEAPQTADDRIRVQFGDLPVPDLAPAVASPPSLDRAKVAIVTTAGLTTGGHHRLWTIGDTSFSVLPGNARDLQLSHVSPNLDRVGIVADLNVVYPIDRLQEWADEGRIGSLNERHLSFMGAQMDFTTILTDTGPAAAQLLLDDGVDVVLLTPV